MRTFTRKFLSVLSLLFLITALYGQIPDNYWDGTDGLTGDSLKQKLHDIISANVTYQSYTPGVWDAFYTTDVHPDNTDQIWDMYGEPSYTYTVGDDQCGTYSTEGDCYNREHSFPKSWFGGSTDPGPGTDLHHIFATDGYVNSRRSNYPYGNVGDATWTSLNGSKLGSCSDPNYSGTVFEPIDEYKGDFARALFYMAVMYKDELPQWLADYSDDYDIDVVFQPDGTFQPWYYEMMYQWHVNDPVSDKERNRDTAVYNIQGNANPFIEHPEWVCMVFGGGSCVSDPQNFVAQPATTTSIDLSWELNSDGDQVVLAYSTDGTFGTPSGNYSAGDAISGGGTVLYVGTNTSFSHTGLSQQTYYYKIWSQNSNGDYSGGVTASAAPVKAEPADYPTNFAASASSSSQIDLSWTDVSSSPVPDGYLILANTSGSFTAPTDGTDPAEDTDLSDGSAVVKVAQGNQAYSFTGLNATTTYYFTIYPYTNSGSTIDFKTDGTAPTANATTPEAPAGGCFSDLIISEYCEGSSYNKYIEIYNGTGSTVNLDDYRIGMVTNGGSWTESSIAFTSGATIADGEVYVLANSSADQTVLDKANQTSGSLSFNGDDAVALQKTTDGGSTWTNIDQIGTDGSDPGTGWDVAGVSNATADHTLVRKSSVNDPTTDWAASAGTDADDSQWIVYSQDYFDDLGTHTADCNSSTTCSAPTTNASNVSFSSVTSTSFTVSWTNGDGENRLVLVKNASAVDALPSDSTTYTANATFGSGSEIGTGNYVVYNGSGSSVTVSGLTPGNDYYVEVVEYNCSAGSELYLTSGTLAQGNTSTLPASITDLSTSCVAASQIDLTWSLPSGNYDGIVITVSDAVTPPAPTCDGSTLSNAQADFSSADVYCSNSDGAKYVYNSTGTSLSVTGLTKGNTYHFVAYVYRNSQWSQAGNELVVTANVEEVSDFVTSCGNGQSSLQWTNPSCFDEVMVAVDTESITAVPSGTYTANSSSFTDANNPQLSDGSVVVYNGTGTNVDVTDLTNGQEYYFKIFVRKGTDWSDGTELNCTPSDATILEYGDLAIVALNTDVGTPQSGADEIQFVCFKDITPNTAIDFTDNGYERETAGKWGDTEGTVRITRTGNTVPAGTIIMIQGNDQGSDPTLGDKWNIYVGGNLDNDNWTIEYLNNVGTSYGNFDLNSSDQVWFMQGGDWLTNGTFGSHDDVYTGTVLYGWTATGWEPEPGYSSTSGSTLYPHGECSNTNVTGLTNSDKVKYVGPTTAATQREWISRFNNSENWSGYADNTSYSSGGSLSSSISIVTGNFAQNWIGDVDSNWCNCGNWGDLKVPDEYSDVIFDASTAQNDLVVPEDTNCVCRSLTLQGDTALYKVLLSGSNTRVLTIKGDLTIKNDSLLILDDGEDQTLDGVLYIGGDWINNAGTNGFFEGNSTVIFNGSSAQSISSTEDETFYNIKIDNTSTVSLSSSLIALQTFTLQNGTLELNGHDLTIDADYHRTSGYFDGDANSGITIENSGDLADFYFTDNDTLKSFVLNRNDTAFFRTGLTITGNLDILSGSIRLEPGKFYSFVGTIDNQSGSEGLIIGSSSAGTASLIHYSQNIPAIAEIYMNSGRWYYLSSVLSSAATDSLTKTTDGRTNYNLYTYDETKADYWNSTSMFGESGWVSAYGQDNIDTSKAYIFYSPEQRIYRLRGGNLHAGRKLITVTYTQSDTGDISVPDLGDRPWTEFDGWNLIGNPYPSAIDWDKVVLNNVENVVYYYDGADQNYKYYQGTGGTVYNQGLSVNGGTNIIPPNQGFFVKATANGYVLIEDSARVHSTTPLWKSTGAKPVQQFVKLRIDDGRYSDETIIQLAQDADNSFDAKYDAYKRFSFNPDVPQIYTLGNDSVVYAINAMQKESTIELALGTKLVSQRGYIISAGLFNLDGYNVWLIDSTSGKVTNLNDEDYRFTASGDENMTVILDKNVQPVAVASYISREIHTGQTIEIPVDKYFSDDNLFDTLSFSLENDYPSVKSVLQSSNLLITSDFAGEYDLTITAIDRAGLKAEVPLHLIVDKVEDQMPANGVYPNPSDGIYTVYVSDVFVGAKAVVTDYLGREVLSQVLDNRNNYLNITHMPSGVYILKITKGDNEKVYKLIKR